MVIGGKNDIMLYLFVSKYKDVKQIKGKQIKPLK
jgi:hypothetical protein